MCVLAEKERERKYERERERENEIPTQDANCDDVLLCVFSSKDKLRVGNFIRCDGIALLLFSATMLKCII
jgi:hypothetical protein